MEIFILFFIMLVIIALQARLFKKNCFKKFDYSCSFSRDEVFEGEQIEMRETIANRKWLPIPWLKSEITASKWLDFAGSKSVVTHNSRFVPSFFMIKSYQKVTRRWIVTCTRRGVFPVESIVLVSTDLLGKSSLSKSIEQRPTVMVLPQPADLSRMFVLPHYLQGDAPVKSQLIPDPFYVSGVREYLPSDPMKNIHWNATAKLGRIMVRNQEYTSRQSMTVVLNMQSRAFERGPAVDPDLLEKGIKVVAALLDETLESGIPVALAANTSLTLENGETIETTLNYGREHLMGLLRILARLPAEGTLDLQVYLKEQCRRLTSTDLILVTAFLTEEVADLLREMEAEGKRVTVYLLDTTYSVIPDNLTIYCPAVTLAEPGKGGAAG